MSEQISVRLDSELINKIKKLAKSNNRSINGQINYLLKQSFNENDLEKKIDMVLEKLDK